MKSYAAFVHHRGKSSGWSLLGGATPFRSARAPATEEIARPVSPRVSLAIVVLPSMALWALIWFALRSLISNWP